MSNQRSKTNNRSRLKSRTQPSCFNGSLLKSNGVHLPCVSKMEARIKKRRPPMQAGMTADSWERRVSELPNLNSAISLRLKTFRPCFLRVCSISSNVYAPTSVRRHAVSGTAHSPKVPSGCISLPACMLSCTKTSVKNASSVRSNVGLPGEVPLSFLPPGGEILKSSQTSSASMTSWPITSERFTSVPPFELELAVEDLFLSNGHSRFQ